MATSILIISIYAVILVVICIRIIFYSETPSKALGYLLLVVFLPIFGVLVYFSVGLNYRKKKLYRKKLEIDDLAYPKLSQKLFNYTYDTLLNNQEKIGYFYRLATYSERKNLTSANNTASLLVNGEMKFPDVFASIKNAKHHIHIEYYIYENDNIGEQLAQLLIQKAREGVQVRFIYDDFGSRKIRKNIVRQMKEAGVEAYPFYKVKLVMLANRLNYRNHRKIIIIDGYIGYIGGINVSDKYINQQKSKVFWRDTHLKIVGTSVVNLQFVFLTDWNFCANQTISFSDDYFPVVNESKPYGNQLVQVISSGPDSKYPSIKYTLIQAILRAKHTILITTPYFIPDKSFLDAILIAAISGVNVKLLMPGISDSFIVNTTSQSYYQELLDAGVEIYTYTKGFVHAKTMVCDEKLAIIGTANLDNRSFDLNFEINAMVFDEIIAKELAEIFNQDISISRQIFSEEWRKRPLHRKFTERLFNLFSSLM